MSDETTGVNDEIGLLEGLASTRSIRRYRDEPVPPAVLAKILEAPGLARLTDLHIEPVPVREHLTAFADVLRAHRDRDLTLHWDSAPPALREVAPALFAIAPPTRRRK